uniref:Uncharacterized protein n=1 Tax=Timema shepardi TaxID=629360 RepID=A0A7R9AQB8_TIMSH|nr:unnamed protein product [Timema shepardi]
MFTCTCVKVELKIFLERPPSVHPAGIQAPCLPVIASLVQHENDTVDQTGPVLDHVPFQPTIQIKSEANRMVTDTFWKEPWKEREGKIMAALLPIFALAQAQLQEPSVSAYYVLVPEHHLTKRGVYGEDAEGGGGDYGGHDFNAQHSVEVVHHQSIPIVKTVRVPVPHHVPVPVPHPVPVPVPQPYPVHVRVPQRVEVPYIKHVQVPVEKLYPVHVDKPVPVPVEKPYHVYVEKHIPVPIPKPYPVHVPVYKHIYHAPKHSSHHSGGWH